MIKDFIVEYQRYKTLAEKAIAQISEGDINRVVSPDNNSIAILMRHIGGNLRSRFTDFLTTDGEKPWRNRDVEFEDGNFDLVEIRKIWDDGWNALNSELANLDEEHLGQTVCIRGEPWTVHAALCRSLAHTSYHVGQMVFLARILNDGHWESLSIPKGRSNEYNKFPTKEKKPE